jgi:AcrR family transcriptional regulator
VTVAQVDRHPGGRPTKLTAEVSTRIVEAMEKGNYLETAAAYAGVHKATVYRWLSDGESPDSPSELREFRDAVMRARAHAEHRMVAVIDRTAQGGAILSETRRELPDGTVETECRYAAPDGRLALEFLGRAHPTRWGRRGSLEVTGAEGGPIQVMSEESLTVHAQRLATHLRELREHPVIEGTTETGR